MTTESRIKTTCPRDCYDACGIVAVRREGAPLKIVGDPDHERAKGALCPKCALAYNGVWQDPQARLNSPLRRTGPKGQGVFEPVTWDEALTDIASRLKGILDRSGGSSVFHSHYTGTCSMVAGNMPMRFFNRIGATEVDPDTVCNKAGHEALNRMFGNSLGGFDPSTATHAQCLIVWGANPSASAPHIHKHWLPRVQLNATLIVVDPIAHDTARMADIHLQLRPGTDAVLAFGMLHVLRQEGLLDLEFIQSSVEGWEDIKTEIDLCTPSIVEEQTGVPAALMTEAALAYGAGNSMLWLGQGLQRQPMAGNIMRSVSLLPTGTGNLGKPGTGFLYLNAFADRGVDNGYLSGIALRKHSAAPVSHMDLVDALETRCRALFTWNNNIAASNPRQHELRNALQSEHLFHVALDLFHTDTTRFADYVLPASSFLEFDDLVVSYFDYTVSAQVKVTEPLGRSLPNQEIFRRLAAAIGFDDEALYESDIEIIEKLLKQLGINASFATLAELGTVPWRDTPVVHFRDGRYPTPSGKVVVSSPIWEEAGVHRFPRAVCDLPAPRGMFRLLSPSDEWLMNTSYGNDARILKKIGRQKVWMNPEDVHRCGLTEGQRVRLSNQTGSLDLDVGCSDRLSTGVVLVQKGRWLMNEAAHANVNALNPGEKTDLGESSAVHGILVSIEAQSMDVA